VDPKNLIFTLKTIHMKRITLGGLLLCLVGLILYGCTVHEEKTEIVIPLPEIISPIEPQPWQPEGNGEEPIGH